MIGDHAPQVKIDSCKMFPWHATNCPISEPVVHVNLVVISRVLGDVMICVHQKKIDVKYENFHFKIVMFANS